MTIALYPPYGSGPGNSLYISYSGMQTDAFGRLRASEPYTLFDSQNRYEKDDQFDESTASGGSTTYLPNESTVRLDVTTASGSEVIRQSFRRLHYQPGKSLLTLQTFVMNEPKSNLRQRLGYFDTQNGCFFQLNDSTKSFVLRSYTSGSVVESTVNQSNWNGDKLDGTGLSGVTLDTSKAQILFFDFEWLGVGNVRCGFIINGQYIVCHTFMNSNAITSVYMTTAILPLRYELTNTGATSTSSSMKQICATVISEGGYQRVVKESVARRTSVLSSISTTFVPLVSIRLASNSLGAVVLPYKINTLPTVSQDYEIVLTKNASLTGASYNTTEFNHVDYDVSATAMSGGLIVQSNYDSASQLSVSPLSTSGYNFDLQLGASLAGVSDVYTLGVRTVAGATSGEAIGSISFYDLTD